jgi:hypothetical protein
MNILIISLHSHDGRDVRREVPENFTSASAIAAVVKGDLLALSGPSVIGTWLR